MWGVCVCVSVCPSVCVCVPLLLHFFSRSGQARELSRIGRHARLATPRQAPCARHQAAANPGSYTCNIHCHISAFSTFYSSYPFLHKFGPYVPFFRFGPELQGVCLHIVFRHFLWCLIVVLLCCACGVPSLFMSFFSFLASLCSCVFFQFSSRFLHVFSCCATTFPILIDVRSCSPLYLCCSPSV